MRWPAAGRVAALTALVCAYLLGSGFLVGPAGAWVDLSETRPAEDEIDPALPLFCDQNLAIFESLRHGAFDYCRLHLGYRPGRADCLRILLPTCNVLSPGESPRVFSGKADWILHGHGERIICPPGPPPPSCPAGLPDGPIPRP